jgi:hypothetical protein
VEVLIGAVLLALVAAFVLRPLFAPSDRKPREDPGIADLEARKEAKYREIRDAQLDHAAGKLSAADFQRQAAELRAEAADLLARLDEARGREGAAGLGSGEDGDGGGAPSR